MIAGFHPAGSDRIFRFPDWILRSEVVLKLLQEALEISVPDRNSSGLVIDIGSEPFESDASEIRHDIKNFVIVVGKVLSALRKMQRTEG